MVNPVVGTVAIPEAAQQGQLRTLMTYISQRMMLATRAGITFTGNRDIYRTLGYMRIIRFFDLYSRYVRGGIARRVVDLPPSATWQIPPIISESEDPTPKTPFEKSIIDLANTTKMWHFIERADRLAGIGRYGTLLIGAPGRLQDPLPRGGKVLYFAPFTEYTSPVKTIDSDPTSERFGLPLTYSIRVGSDLIGSILPNNSPSLTSLLEVHWTRVLHIAEGLLEDQVYGTPRLLPAWNYFDDLDKIEGATGEAYWRIADRGLQFDIDKEMQAPTGPEAEKMTQEFEDYINGFQRYIRTQGVKVNPLGSEAPNPKFAAELAVSLISATTGIPVKILMGVQAGKASSDTDDSSWKEMTSCRQNQYADPTILRVLFDRLIDFNYLPEPKSGEYSAIWPDLFSLSEQDRALVAMRYGSAIQMISQAFATGNCPVSQEEARPWFGVPAQGGPKMAGPAPVGTPGVSKQSTPGGGGSGTVKSNPQAKAVTGRGKEKMT